MKVLVRFLQGLFLLTTVAIIGIICFNLGKVTSELDCDQWCAARIDYFTFDGYLACKSVCHEIEVGHVLCTFAKIDNAKADQFLEDHGNVVKRKDEKQPKQPKGDTL